MVALVRYGAEGKVIAGVFAKYGSFAMCVLGLVVVNPKT